VSPATVWNKAAQIKADYRTSDDTLAAASHWAARALPLTFFSPVVDKKSKWMNSFEKLQSPNLHIKRFVYK